QRTRRILERFQSIEHQEGAMRADIFQKRDRFVACGRRAIRQRLSLVASEKSEGGGDERFRRSSGLIARALAVKGPVEVGRAVVVADGELIRPLDNDGGFAFTTNAAND